MGASKTFFDTKNLIWPNFWGVILLKLFDPSNSLEVGNVQNSHFWPKSALDISKSAGRIKKNQGLKKPLFDFLRDGTNSPRFLIIANSPIVTFLIRWLEALLSDFQTWG